MNTEVIRRRPRPHRENGDKIKSLRSRLGGVTQDAAAARVGISRRYFIQLETGEKLPSGELRDRIAAVLGGAPGELQASDDDEESSLPLSDDQAADMLIALIRRIAKEEA